jgi:hypothetical protein
MDARARYAGAMTGAEDRRARLAAALRANLRRRRGTATSAAMAAGRGRHPLVAGATDETPGDGAPDSAVGAAPGDGEHLTGDPPARS